jgi:cell division protein ZapA (FtsZ GTPase activity inhibitor)
MSIVTITLNNKNFQLLCNDGSENQLIELARKLDEKIAEIKTANPASSFELLLVMSALSLQDQTQNLNNKLDKINGSKNNDEDEKFAETLSTIALYLENLAQKIGK